MARILIIGSYADSLVRFRQALILDLVEAGHSVVVAAPDAVAVLRHVFWRDRIEVHDISMRRTGLNPFADFSVYMAMRNLIDEVRPDAILAYTIKPILYAGLAVRARPGIKFYPILTGLGFVFQSQRLKAQLIRAVIAPFYRRALRRADLLFFQNFDNLEALRRGKYFGASQPTRVVAGSGVDLGYYAPADLPAAPSVLMIARLLKDKGVMEYAQAAELVRAGRPDVEFRLVGWFDEGNPQSIDRRALENWQRAGTIIWLGPADDVRPALAECSLYVLPSYHEGMPRTVLEAMATGRPIVTTDVPGCRETIEPGGNGVLVPPRDPSTLARAILAIIEDPNLARAMAARSLELARERFDVHLVNKHMLDAMQLSP